jgi:hypothetical protein
MPDITPARVTQLARKRLFARSAQRPVFLQVRASARVWR